MRSSCADPRKLVSTPPGCDRVQQYEPEWNYQRNPKPQRQHRLVHLAGRHGIRGHPNDKNVGALLVTENDKLAGIISERDYTRKVIVKGKSSKKTAVREILSRSETNR